MRDLHNNLKVSQLVDPATLTSDTDSASVDMQGYDSCEMAVAVGESGDTLSGSVYWQLILEESDDDATFTTVAAADMLVKGNAITSPSGGVFALIDDAAEDDAVYKVGYIGGKRYVRVNVKPTGTHTNGTPIGVLGVQGNAALASVN